MKRIIVVFSVFLILSSMVLPLYAADDSEPGGGAMLADLFMVRPLSFAALVIGTAASIVATPFALASGNTGKVYEKMVVEPYRYTVCRPLGTGM